MKRVSVLLLLFVGAGVLSADDSPPTTDVAKWYAEDPGRAPRCQVERQVEIACPDIHRIVAAVKYTLLHDEYWKNARWNQDEDIHQIRRAAAAALDDPNLVLAWKQDQIPLSKLPPEGRSAGACTTDRDHIVFNQLGLLRLTGGGSLERRPGVEIGVTLAHELVHIWDKRGSWSLAKTTDVSGVGIAYDFEKLVPTDSLGEKALEEIGRVLGDRKQQQADELTDALQKARARLGDGRTLRRKILGELASLENEVSSATQALTDLRAKVDAADAGAKGVGAVIGLGKAAADLWEKVKALDESYEALGKSGDAAHRVRDTVRGYADRAPSASDEQLDAWIDESGTSINDAALTVEDALKKAMRAEREVTGDLAANVRSWSDALERNRALLASSIDSLPQPSSLSREATSAVAGVDRIRGTVKADREALDAIVSEIHGMLAAYLAKPEAASLDAEASRLTEGLVEPSSQAMTQAQADLAAAILQYAADEKLVPRPMPTNADETLAVARHVLERLDGVGASARYWFSMAKTPLDEAAVAYRKLCEIREGRKAHGDVAVPSVTGLKPSAAREALVAAGFKVSFAPSANAVPTKEAEYTVDSQTPAAGESAAKGALVTCYLFQKLGSEEADLVDVPGVLFLKAGDARYELALAGLVPAYEANDEVPPTPADAYTVKSQNPSKGARVRTGSIVVLRMYGDVQGSKPPARPPDDAGTTATQGMANPGIEPPSVSLVPPVKGMKRQDALAALEAAGLKGVEDHHQPARTPDEVDVVYDQFPPAETLAPADRTVILYVNGEVRSPGAGSEPPSSEAPSPPSPPPFVPQQVTTVPGVIGMTRDEAARALAEAGIQRLQFQGGKAAPSGDQVGRVYHQEPRPGGSLPDDAMMLLWVYADPAMAQDATQDGPQGSPPPPGGAGRPAAGAGPHGGGDSDDEGLKALQAFLDGLNKGLQQGNQNPPSRRRRRRDNGAPAPVPPSESTQPPAPSQSPASSPSVSEAGKPWFLGYWNGTEEDGAGGEAPLILDIFEDSEGYRIGGSYNSFGFESMRVTAWNDGALSAVLKDEYNQYRYDLTRDGDSMRGTYTHDFKPDSGNAVHDVRQVRVRRER